MCRNNKIDLDWVGKIHYYSGKKVLEDFWKEGLWKN